MSDIKIDKTQKRVLSNETKLKISNSLKGKNTWAKGSKKIQSEEHKKKNIENLKKARLSITSESRKKNSDSRKGQKINEKQKEALSIGRELNKGRKHTKETKEKNRLSQIGKKSGSKHPSWKGGITPENKKIRNSTDCKYWRKSCFERDNFTCQKTGQHGGKLVVHHINNFSEFPELRFEITNGITLSHNAHMEFHNKYGRKNNTLEQLNEFLYG